MERLHTWPERMPLVGDVRGHGLMIGVEIVSDKMKKTAAPDLRDRIVEAAFEKGLLFLGCGPNTLRISPPLVVSREQADIALDALEESIRQAARA